MDLENTVGINDNDDYSIALKCPVIIEFLDFHGSVARKIISKQATIRLVRNEFKDIILQILSENGILNYTVREMTLHKRFICEGKASVHLCDHNVKILISNCAPSKLTVFLKTLYCKMRVQKQTQTNISYKSRLLSNIPRKLTEISPLTACDINASHSVTGRVSCPESTPVSCKKRKVEEQSLGSLEKRVSKIFN